MLHALLPYRPPASAPSEPAREEASDDAGFEHALQSASQDDHAPEPPEASKPDGERPRDQAPARPAPGPRTEPSEPRPSAALDGPPPTAAPPTEAAAAINATGPSTAQASGASSLLDLDSAASHVKDDHRRSAIPAGSLEPASVGTRPGLASSRAGNTAPSSSVAADGAAPTRHGDAATRVAAATASASNGPATGAATAATSTDLPPVTVSSAPSTSTTAGSADGTRPNVADGAASTPTAATPSPADRGNDHHASGEQGASGREPDFSRLATRAAERHDRVTDAADTPALPKATAVSQGATTESGNTAQHTGAPTAGTQSLASDGQQQASSFAAESSSGVAATTGATGATTTNSANALGGATGRATAQAAGVEVPSAAELADQIKVRLSPKRPEITVRLDPPELGRLFIKLAMRGGELAATVTADDARVAKAFEGDVGRLYRTLDDAGIRVSEVEIKTNLDASGERTHEGARDRRDANADADREAAPRSDRAPKGASGPADATSNGSPAVTLKRTSTLDVVV